MSQLPTLLRLVRKGDSQKLGSLLADHPNSLSQLDPKTGSALLHVAIEQGDFQCLQTIVHAGADIELPTKAGESPLQVAVRVNDPSLLAFLLERRANPRRRNAQGETALHLALRNQTNPDILKRLLSKVPDLNEKVQNFGSYLNLAIMASQRENALMLLNEQGLRLTIVDDEDNTCLILAVRKGQGDIVVAILEKLQKDILLTPLEKQFFINAQNRQGNTALHEAVINDLQTISQRLETSGATLGIDLELKNKKGQTVASIRQTRAKNREGEAQAEKKRQIERVQRKKEKEEDKHKQRQLEEQAEIQAKRQLKEQEQRAAIAARVEAAALKKKTIWGMGILLIIVLAGMYIALTSHIEKKKAMAFTL